jgi:uncharacterized protein YdeI (YjbR/CyaY-like superfamily)
MPGKIKAIDDYISKSAAFAQPILKHFRELVHKACPEVEEKMKWSFPHFDYKQEMMCSMAAFKQHCAISFWKAALMKDSKLIENARSEEAMGHLGKIISLKDLPSDKILTSYIKEAMKLNEEGIKLPSRPVATVKKELEVPGYFLNALQKNKKALKVFEAFAYSNKKEYLQWITEAKTEDTRIKRMTTAIEWIAEGKGRNWKYQK